MMSKQLKMASLVPTLASVLVLTGLSVLLLALLLACSCAHGDAVPGVSFWDAQTQVMVRCRARFFESGGMGRSPSPRSWN